MKIIACEQNSSEWFRSRLGIPSASNFDKIIKRDGTPSKQREEYIFKLAGERVYGEIEEGFKNSAMQRGIELEPEARCFYELITGNKVEQVGFCVTESEPIYGASPDGLVGDEGLLEIKCPMLATHVSYLLTDKIPKDYFHQVQGQLLVTGRKWCDLMSYYPSMKPIIIRVFPDIEFQKALKEALEKFCVEVEETVKKVI